MENRRGQKPIIISKSATADTRSCDFAMVSRTQLLESSESHIADVKAGMNLFIAEMRRAAERHDWGENQCRQMN